jgi:hypothetical protein
VESGGQKGKVKKKDRYASHNHIKPYGPKLNKKPRHNRIEALQKNSKPTSYAHVNSRFFFVIITSNPSFPMGFLSLNKYN